MPLAGVSRVLARLLRAVREEKEDMTHELCEQALRDNGRKLAQVTSERDFLRERCRELAESFDVEAERWHDDAARGSAIAAARYASWAAAAAKLRQIVTEAEDVGNGTATPA